jgi:hypothetical protein
MKTSTTIIKIAPALLAAQKEIGSASKDAVNPFFKSKYADLGSVMEACKEALNKNGITVLQPVGTDGMGATLLETILLHESGEFMSDTMSVTVKQQNDPQAQGSAITYARRYSLQSMVFIPAEDDDAEKATNHASTPAVRSVPVEDKCVKCGAPMAVSKSTGSLYCSALCWKRPLPKEEPKEVDIDEIEINEVPF